MEMQIRIENLDKYYGKKHALDHVNLTISQGMFGLLGRNGAGKTTLMKILAALQKKQGGRVEICGVPVEDRAKIRQMTGYLPQDFSMYPNMTVYEAMDYLGVLSGLKKDFRKKRIPILLEKVNLQEDRNKKIKALSGGMKRRLGIAQAILHEPKVLIVDEPTAGLDPEERVRFRNLLCEIAQDRIVLLSTHIVGDIEATCDEIGIMDKGKILYRGTVRELNKMAEGKVYTAQISRRELPEFELFKKECAQTGKSLIYWVYVLCLLLFFFTQMGNPGFDSQRKPVKGEVDTYGMVTSTDKEVIMEQTLGILGQNLYYDEWSTYPAGFVKYVSLSSREKEEIWNILGECTGLALEELRGKIDTEMESYKQAEGYLDAYMQPLILEPSDTLSYDEFQEKMERICQILGPGSDFEKSSYEQGYSVPATYEEAMEEYNSFLYDDKITGGYARLFGDYMGIALGILPVFLVVTRELRDRRAGMEELIYTRTASSGKIVLSRWLSMNFMMILPVLLASFYTLFQCAAYARGLEVSVDYLAFMPVVFGWLLPEILIVSALGMFLTDIGSSPLAILVQGIWWFGDVFAGSNTGLATGDFGLHLVLRFNSTGGRQTFLDHFSQLTANRIFYFLLAMILLVLTVIVYSEKRKGRWDFRGKIRSYRKRKSEV